MNTETFEQMHLTGRDYWWYQAKEYLMELLLKQAAWELPLDRNAKVLDVGCGTGTMFGFLSERGDLVGLEPSQRAIEYAATRHTGSLVQADATQPPFSEQTFDLIGMFDSLEHMDDDLAALQHARNIIRDDGVLLVTAPAFQWLHSWRETQLGHRRRYTRKSMGQAVENAGFTVHFTSYMYCGLFPVLVLKSIKDRFIPPPKTFKSDIVMLPEPWNSILAGWFSIEAWICSRFGLPFGTSVVCVASPDGSRSAVTDRRDI